MLKGIQQRDLARNRWIKITMSVILLLICASMLLYLIPGLNSGQATGASATTVAKVGNYEISTNEVQRMLNQQMRNQSIPPLLKGFYAQEILNQLIFVRALDMEADRLGIHVTPEEQRDKIKQYLPTVFDGDTWLKDRYPTEVQRLTGMSVQDFETALRNQMLQEKFHEMVTDGISVTPDEVQAEFRRRNEKVKIEYVQLKPTEIAPTIHPSDAELNAYFAKNSAKYQAPEKRAVRYALLDTGKLRDQIHVSDADLQAYYTAHIGQYRVENRVHVQHILFKTVGKTDAEVAEIRAKAEDVLKKAKKGANFEELAKQYTEDDLSKEKGGDLGWITQGQTVAEFQAAAFGLPKGSISDLVKTQYGFHIIKVIDHENAHTKTLDEVRAEITPIILQDKVNALSGDVYSKLAAAVRQSNRQPLDELAKKFNLTIGDTPPTAFNDPIVILGNSPELHQTIAQLRPGELSMPIQVPAGWAILAVKDIQPAHAATLAEAHDQILGDYQKDKSTELAKTKADELAKRVQGGEDLAKAAKAMGLEVKTPDSFSRTGTVPDIGSGAQLQAAFNMPVGQVSAPTQIGATWLVYRVEGHEPPNMDDFAKQSDQLKQQLLQQKQTAAYEAFQKSLKDRLKAEGKIVEYPEAMKRLTARS
jgi:peptidyl-prolyl cis-trans isomerase D